MMRSLSSSLSISSFAIIHMNPFAWKTETDDIYSEKWYKWDRAIKWSSDKIHASRKSNQNVLYFVYTFSRSASCPFSQFNVVWSIWAKLSWPLVVVAAAVSRVHLPVCVDWAFAYPRFLFTLLFCSLHLLLLCVLVPDTWIVYRLLALAFALSSSCPPRVYIVNERSCLSNNNGRWCRCKCNHNSSFVFSKC